LVTRVEPSPYGGWWVYCVPIDLLIDSMDFYFAPSHRNRATLLRRTL